MICMAMCGSGAMIGMGHSHLAQTHKVLLRGLLGCCEVDVGLIMQNVASHLAEGGMFQLQKARILVFAFVYQQNSMRGSLASASVGHSFISERCAFPISVSAVMHTRS